MKQSTQQSMHQLSGGNGILWTLRGMFTSGRDVTLTPESGVFQSEKPADPPRQVVKKDTPNPVRRRRAEWITPNQTYRIGGQLTEVYAKTIGVRLAVHA